MAWTMDEPDRRAEMERANGVAITAQQIADRIFIDRLRILLPGPAAACVASTVSLRQSATETKPAFVRRIVGAFLDEVTL